MMARSLISQVQSRKELLGAVVIAVAAVAVYERSLSGPFLLDDDLLLTQNRLVAAPDGLRRIWLTSEPVDYWPITNSSFWLEWRAWGLDPTGYKVTNLVLHIAGSLLLWVVLARLSIPGAWLAALAFTVHPVNVESVAWIAQRKNVLSLLFFLASVYSFVRSDDERTATAGKPRGRPGLWYWLSLATFLLAMLSKASVVTLPFVLMGILWARRRIGSADITGLAPFFVVAAALTLLNMWFRSHGRELEIRQADFLQRLLAASGVMWFYLGKAILPLNLAFIYPQWKANASHWLWWGPLLATIATTAVLWRYRNAWARPLWLAWLYFCAMLIPVMGFIDAGYMKYSLVADHYQHLALIGVVALGAAFWSQWRASAFKSSPNAADLVAVVVIGALALLTSRQSKLYANNIELYKDSLEKNPNSDALHCLLGYCHEAAGRFDIAADEYRTATERNPTVAKYFNNLAVVQVHLGLHREALANFRRAIQLRPDFAECYRNLAWAVSQSGQWKQAVALCRRSLELDPNDYRALRFCGISLLENHQAVEAESEFRACLRVDSDDAEIWWYLAKAQAAQDQTAKAQASAQQALKLAREQQQPNLTKKIESLLEQLRTETSSP